MSADVEPTGTDRRGFIKRAAVVGGATAWATPTVQSLVTPAFALGTQPGECNACLSGVGQILETATSKVKCYGKNIGKLTFLMYDVCCGGKGKSKIVVIAHTNKYSKSSKYDVPFYFDRNLQITCTTVADPNAAPAPKTTTTKPPTPSSPTCPNKFVGTMQDSKGNLLSFSFEDYGKPGYMVDKVSLTVKSAGGAVLVQGAGSLSWGSLQTHSSEGLCKRECRGC